MARSLTRGFFSIVNAKLLRSLLSVVSIPVVVRLLGPSGYGDYAFLLSTFSLLMILVSSGVTEGVQKFAAEDRGDHWRANVVGFYFKLALVLAAIGSLALAAATWGGLVRRWLGPGFDLYFYLLALFVITAQMRAFARRTLMGFGLETHSESLYVAQKLIWLGIGLGLATLGFGVAGFLLGNIVAAGVVALVGCAILARRVSITGVVGRTAKTVSRRELLTFNVLNVLLVLLLLSLFHVDVLMLRVLGGSEQTGYYRAALAIAEYIWLVPIALQTLLLHSTSPLWADERLDRITELSSSITRYVFLLTALLGIGVFTLADSFVPLYFGSEFTAVVVPLAYLLPGAFGFALARPLYAINQAKGDLPPLIAATGIAAGLNVALNLILIPQYGMRGAAIATSIGYGSMFVLQVGCARYLGVDPLADLRVPRLLTAVVISAPVVYGVDAVLAGDGISLVIVPPLGLAVFLVVSLTTRALAPSEVLDAITACPEPLERRLRTLVPDGWESRYAD